MPDTSERGPDRLHPWSDPRWPRLGPWAYDLSVRRTIYDRVVIGGVRAPATRRARPARPARDGGLSARRDGLVDAALAVAVAAGLLAVSMVSFPVISLPQPGTAVVVTAFMVLHATIALRRTAPAWGYGLACAAMLIVVLAPQARVREPAGTGLAAFPVLFFPSSTVFLPALYAAAARSGRRAAAAFLAVAVGGALLAAARIDPAAQVGAALAAQYRVYLTLALLSAVSAAWGLGVWQAVRTEREAAARAEAARVAILADRAAIARDMHDVVSHSLAVIVRQAEGGAALAAQAPGRAGEVLRTIADVGRDALADMRGMVDVLRGPEACAPTTDGTPALPRAAAPSSLADLPAVLDRIRGTGVEVTLHESGPRHEIGPAAQLAAFHVVRETLTNVVKHAGPASRVRIDLDWGPQALGLTIRDDGGAGGTPATLPDGPVPGTGTGLLGLAERVAAAGGSITGQPLAPGFVVHAGFPRRITGTVAGEPAG